MSPRASRSHVSQDRWLVSYADFITLLFAFFVVLYAFATTNQKKQSEIPAAIDHAFRSLGIVPHAMRGPGGENTANPPAIPANMVMDEEVLAPIRIKEDLENLHRELAQSLSSQVASHAVSIRMGRDGLVISLREAGFFDSGSALPKPETLPTLRRIAAALSRTPYDVRIEGHTDNTPIHNAQFDSNWELSAARATHIARLLLEMKVISPNRISAAGYAEFHPVASNGTAQGRAENRRVDLVILPRTRIDFSAPDPTQAGGKTHKIAGE